MLDTSFGEPSLNLVHAHVLLYSTNHPFRISIFDWDRREATAPPTNMHLCLNLNRRKFNEDDVRRRYVVRENKKVRVLSDSNRLFAI